MEVHCAIRILPRCRRDAGAPSWPTGRLRQRDKSKAHPRRMPAGRRRSQGPTRRLTPRDIPAARTRQMPARRQRSQLADWTTEATRQISSLPSPDAGETPALPGWDAGAPRWPTRRLTPRNIPAARTRQMPAGLRRSQAYVRGAQCKDAGGTPALPGIRPWRAVQRCRRDAGAPRHTSVAREDSRTRRAKMPAGRQRSQWADWTTEATTHATRHSCGSHSSGPSPYYVYFVANSLECPLRGTDTV